MTLLLLLLPPVLMVTVHDGDGDDNEKDNSSYVVPGFLEMPPPGCIQYALAGGGISGSLTTGKNSDDGDDVGGIWSHWGWALWMLTMMMD
jgi:hypothetical protein